MILLILAGCVLPTPTVSPVVTETPAPVVTPTVTNMPYPNPVDYGEIGHQTYPGPVAPASVTVKGEVVEAPTCIGAIEYPSRVYTLPNAPDDVYSETCIWSLLAGSSLDLYDQIDGSVTHIPGKYIGAYPPNCKRYHYRLNSNGLWQVVVMVNDPGGVNLCSVSPYPLERWRYFFLPWPILWNWEVIP